MENVSMKEMNRINIITRHAIVNYGSFFQTLATQEFFESLGLQVTIINYCSKEETILGNLKTNSRKRHGIKRILYLLAKFPDEFIKTIVFHQKTYKFLKLSKRYHSLAELQEGSFTGIICSGSDQIWGLMPDGQLDKSYFLNFGGSDNKFISFSSSFGRMDYSDSDWSIIGESLKKYSLITVRETSSATEINKKFNLKAQEILDPTLLVDESFWYLKTDPKYKTFSSYILVYQLRKNKDLDEFVQKISNEKHLKIIRVSTNIYDLLRKGSVVLKKPSQVLSLFKNASLVISDSFHATVFSIIFKKNFFDVLPPETSLRIVDLLSFLGLSNRIIKDYKVPDIIDSPINYDLVFTKIYDERTIDRDLFLKFLKSNDNGTL
jgi:hypothetical protein